MHLRHWVRATQAENRADNRHVQVYHGGHRHCKVPAKACRWRLAALWHGKFVHALKQKPRFEYPHWWYLEAMCVHSREAAWDTPYGMGPNVSGGMQIGYSEWHHFGGGAFASEAWRATPVQQLTIAWRYYLESDWYPWPNTARACGLI